MQILLRAFLGVLFCFLFQFKHLSPLVLWCLTRSDLMLPLVLNEITEVFPSA